MPYPVDYEVFLANVNEDDLNLLTSFLVGVEAFAHTPAEGEALFAKAQRLYNAGVLSSVSRRYIEAGGIETPVTHQGFLGIVHPVAVGYLGKLARERVILSRDPIPEQP